MKVAEVASAPAFVAHPEQPLVAAARQMRSHQVGALVVVDAHASQQRPVGIITDRDVVCGQFARSKDLYCLTVGDVMTRNPLTILADSELSEAIQTMSAAAVRRFPVVDASGQLVGIITLDDLLPIVAQQLSELAGIARTQIMSWSIKPSESLSDYS
ncbi:MAG: CBS domain-containing protein [Proteobacteria bacterium]|nr:CBS domain-containing protein [Pseudomonadota bacterium]